MISLVRPEGFVSEGDVAGTFICVGSRFLLLRRVPSALNGGAWGKAAGKRKPNETLVECACREIAEETGIAVPPERLVPFVSVYVVRDESFGPVGRQFVYHMFILRLERLPRIDLAPKEHDAFGWYTCDDALVLPLVDSGKECIELYRNAMRDV